MVGVVVVVGSLCVCSSSDERPAPERSRSFSYLIGRKTFCEDQWEGEEGGKEATGETERGGGRSRKREEKKGEEEEGHGC